MTAIEVCRTAALGGLHCVVPGGGISPDGTQWISCRPRFFLSVRVLSRLFRRLFLTHLQEAFDSSKLQFFSALAAPSYVQIRTCGTYRHRSQPLATFLDESRRLKNQAISEDNPFPNIGRLTAYNDHVWLLSPERWSSCQPKSTRVEESTLL
jgi:hypothetical protein